MKNAIMWGLVIAIVSFTLYTIACGLSGAIQ